MKEALVGAGWKSPSLVDVHGAVTFTLWLCGCNLQCPFCHNWRLANYDPDTCKPLDVEKLLDELEASRFLIDFLHVTGGEPLIQFKRLIPLFKRVKGSGIPVSLNTNLTLTEPLERILKLGLLDHVATDLKLPYRELYGLRPEASDKLWVKYIRSISIVADYEIPLELRVPVSSLLSVYVLSDALKPLSNYLSRISQLTVVIQPLFGPPITEPRNGDWCNKFCGVSKEQLDSLQEAFKAHGFSHTFVRSFANFK